MDFINYHRLVEEENGNYTLVIYLNEHEAEFARELSQVDNDTKKDLYNTIKEAVEKRFPKLKVTLCKIMLGSMLLTAIPLVNTMDVSAASTTHKVISGDSLWKIAKRYGTSIDQLKKLNNLSGSMIYIGQNIKVSGTSSTYVPNKYKVSKGDTLWGISNRYKIPVNTIKSLSGLTNNAIYPGQILVLKGTSTTTTTTQKPSVNYSNHKVVAGENLWSISVDYGIPQSELISVNGFSQSTQLSIGQIIKVPVHNVPIKQVSSYKYGENLDWWSEAQYVFTINKVAKVRDYYTGKTFNVKRTIGANHADCEPLTAGDTAIAKSIWGGYSWKTRPVIVEVNGRRLAGSMSFMPHSIQKINNNNFNGHFDIHFANSTRHKDGAVDYDHQAKIKIAAGISA